MTLVSNLTYHFSFIFFNFFFLRIESLIRFYNDYQRFQQEEKHIENLEKIDSFFNGALIGIKSYVAENREKKKVKNW